jgi:hypothetical protein
VFSNHANGANDDPCNISILNNRNTDETDVRAVLSKNSLPEPRKYVIICPILWRSRARYYSCVKFQRVVQLVVQRRL